MSVSLEGAGITLAAGGGGGGSPGGSSTQIQYNGGGTFAGSPNFTWNNATSILSVTGQSIAIAGTAATIVEIVRGAASQTADLQQWQNSASVVQASMDASGNLTLAGSGVCQGIRRRAGNTNFLIGGGGSTATGTYSSITLSPITDGAWVQTSGTFSAVSITPSYNQASGTASNTDLLISRTETAVGSGAQRLIDCQVGGVSRFRVTNTGSANFSSAPATLNSIFIGNDTDRVEVGYDTGGVTLGQIPVQIISDASGNLYLSSRSNSISNVSFWTHNGTTSREVGRWNAAGCLMIGDSVDAGLFRNAAGIIEVNNGTAGTFRDLRLRSLTSSGVVNMASYTVAGLPAGVNNDRAFVTDALTPAFGATVVGGGAVRVPVYFDGAWRVG